jgi:DNA polymerase III sliding clamp (beta) subunit (PCNA family)
MAYRKRDLAVRHCMSKDPYRPHLRGVLLESDGGIVATDGHCLALISPEKPTSRTAAFLDTDALELERLRLKHAGERAFRDAKRGKHAARENTAREIDGDTHAAAQFPNWRAVLPTSKPRATLRIDPAILKRVLAAAEEYLGGVDSGDRYLDLEIRGEMEPMVLRGEDSEHGKFLALIMPMRK